VLERNSSKKLASPKISISIPNLQATEEGSNLGDDGEGRRSFLRGFAVLPALAVMTKLPQHLYPPSQASTVVLADQINTTLDAVQDWSELVDIGIIMGKSTNADFDQRIARKAAKYDWFNVLSTKSQALHAGYSSSTIDECVKLALSNMPMFAEYSVPITQVDTQGHWFWPFSKFMLYPYKYSQELNWETSRWDPNKAFNYLARVYDSFGRGFYRMNDTLDADNPAYTGFAQTLSQGTRWLELGKLMGCFLMFYDMGVTDALPYALKCWGELNANHWKTDHYTYSIYWLGYEFSSMDVIVDSLKLQSRIANLHDGAPLPNAERIVTDLKSRYFSGYGKNQWSNIADNTTVAQHLGAEDGNSNGNPELRLDGTLNAWIINQLAYSKLSGESQALMRAMLEGNGMVKASDGLMQSSLMKDSAFLMTSSSPATTDTATAMAAVCLFLNAISVRAGAGLAIPLITDSENDHAAMNGYHFGFDYENQEIKIPVWGGTTLNFTFGENPVQLSFGDTGIYEIRFSKDWNTILDHQLVSDLNYRESYLNPFESRSL
jgi:hypothetical protein